MTYPVWSGINAEQINSTPINSDAPTPTITSDGFSSAVFPVLMGSYPGLFFEVMRTRYEERRQRPLHETRSFGIPNDLKEMSTLPEDRSVDVERSRKDYP
jgi:hypothetical protein